MPRLIQASTHWLKCSGSSWSPCQGIAGDSVNWPGTSAVLYYSSVQKEWAGFQPAQRVLKGLVLLTTDYYSSMLRGPANGRQNLL